MSGPFETEREARELPAVQAVYEAFRRRPGRGAHGAAQLAGCSMRRARRPGSASAPTTGAILAWLSGWEPETCRRGRWPDHPCL